MARPFVAEVGVANNVPVRRDSHHRLRDDWHVGRNLGSRLKDSLKNLGFTMIAMIPRIALVVMSARMVMVR